MMSIKKIFGNDTIYILVLAVSTFFIYFPALNQYFVLDDSFYWKLGNNINDLKSFFDVFTYRLKTELYRPISVQIFFFFTQALFLNNVFYFHLVNLLLFLFGVILVYFISKEIFENRLIAFLSSFIFITRSLHTIPVYYIAAGEEFIMSIFVFLSFLFYLKFLKNQKRTYKGLSIILFVLALLSKETAFMFPVVLFFYYFIVISKRINIEGVFKAIIELFPFLVIMLVYSFVRIFLLEEVLIKTHGYEMGIGFHIIRNLKAYILFTFDLGINGVTWSYTLLFFLVFSFFIIINNYRKINLNLNNKKIQNKLKIMSFLILWYFIFMVHLLLLKFRFMDYYIHLSIFGFSLIFGLVLFETLNYLEKRFRPIVVVIILLLILFSSKNLSYKRWSTSDVYELQLAGKTCVEELKKYNLQNNDRIVFIDIPYRNRDDGSLMQVSSAHGPLFSVMLNKSLNLSFVRYIYEVESEYEPDYIFEVYRFGCKLKSNI
ncbi:hypothetical protein A3K63_03565 [Candidatus Micrarchaeota archaeon RBG_16_49_10]|nr:MAG: hypothetical protein A3K63_03565 [Candidatus Micrarchaeota archaeon RBG_16_49_10]